LIFSRAIRPEKNREISTVLQSHNMLPARCLQKTIEASIYNNAENNENFDISQSHNLLSEALAKAAEFIIDIDR
jgi:hypothetical protein